MKRFTPLSFCILAALFALTFGLPANNISDIARSDVHVREVPVAQASHREKRQFNGYQGCILCREGEMIKYNIGDIYVAIINATPYRWRRTYCHAYQLSLWTDERWSEYIEPGQAISHLVHNEHEGWQGEDTAGDVTYELEGTEESSSFNLQYRSSDRPPDDRFRIEVVLNGGLSKLKTGRPKGKNIVDLGFIDAPNGVSWLISGKEGSFEASSNAENYQADLDQPVNWMHEMLPLIADRPLQELIMIRSHHSGLWDGRTMGVARHPNCVTQEMDLGEQLRDGGVRVLDVRIYKDGDYFYIAHGTTAPGTFQGCIGEKVEDLIEAVNRFNDEYPGELIIWDFHKETFDANNGHKPLKVRDREALYKLFQDKLHHLAKMAEYGDVSGNAIKYYIGNGTSSVILRFPDAWVEEGPDLFPDTKHGFVSSSRFPVVAKWSDTNDLAKMADEQIYKLYSFRQTRYQKVIDLEWILSPNTGEHMIADDTTGVAALGGHTMRILRAHLWNIMSVFMWNDEAVLMYPNWITLDGITGRETRDLVKAMNYCFVARQCGDWIGIPRKTVFHN